MPLAYYFLYFGVVCNGIAAVHQFGIFPNTCTIHTYTTLWQSSNLDLYSSVLFIFLV